MGCLANATCLDCGQPFTVEDGGGFVFHLLRCDNCGRTKSIGFDTLGELHLRYLKGLPGPYCVGTSEHDKYVREQVDIQPISEEEYHRNVEKIAGKCECQGKYAFEAPPRCPICHSTRIKEGDITLFYD